MKLTKLLSTSVLFGLMTMGASQAAPTLQDVVYVDDPSGPFYMQIFEASKNAVKAAGVISNYNPGNKAKPDRLSFSLARDYCGRIGMTVPTKAQWMVAASNIGRNTRSTLRNDADPATANVSSGDSTTVNYVAQVKIDAVGTMGMTGNRGEWVGTGSQCGGSYQTSNASTLELNRSICRDSSFESSTATVRCIYRVSAPGDVATTVTSMVAGEHKTYLESINYGKPAGSSNTRPGGQTRPQTGNNTQQDQGSVYDRLKEELDIDNRERNFN